MVRRPAGRTSSDVVGSRRCLEAVPRRPGRSLRPSPGSGPPTNPRPARFVRGGRKTGRQGDSGRPTGRAARRLWAVLRMSPPSQLYLERGPTLAAAGVGPINGCRCSGEDGGYMESRSAGGGRVPRLSAVPGRSLVGRRTPRWFMRGRRRGMRVTMDTVKAYSWKAITLGSGACVRPHHAAGARKDVEGRAREQPAARAGRQVCHMGGCAELGHRDRRGSRSRTACGNPHRRKDVAGHGPRGTTRAGTSIAGALNGGHVRRRPRRGDVNLVLTASQTPGGDIAAPSGLNACSLSSLRLAYSIRSASSSGFERK